MDESRTVLCSLPLDENILVKDIKSLLVDHLNVKQTHIRLRHPTTRAIVRDDRRLCRAILNVCDGNQLFVQILSAPEEIGKEDLIIEVREADFIRKMIKKGQDMVVAKTTTLQELFAQVASTFPHLVSSSLETDSSQENGDSTTPTDMFTASVELAAHIAIAKAFTHGPPLTLKSATKLKWNDLAVR